MGEETVALLLRADADPRLLKARAQAICAEAGETRPLVVLGGRASAGSLAGSGGAASGSWGRRTTPVTMVLASLFVLSAILLAPGDSNPPNPLSRRPPSGLASPGAVPARGLETSPTVSAPPALRTGPKLPTFVGSPPVASLPTTVAVGAGPVLARPETASSSATGSVGGPALESGPPTFGPELASAVPSVSRPAGPDQATAPHRPGQPSATDAFEESTAPPGPVADGPAPGIRTSSRGVLATSSEEPTFSASAVSDHRVHRKSADHGRRSSTDHRAAWRATELPSKAETADKADPAARSASAGGTRNAGNDGNFENRGAMAERTGRWGDTDGPSRTGPGGRPT